MGILRWLRDVIHRWLIRDLARPESEEEAAQQTHTW